MLNYDGDYLGNTTSSASSSANDAETACCSIAKHGNNVSNHIRTYLNNVIDLKQAFKSQE